MINLLSPDTKLNIRAARRNVKLRVFTVLSFCVAVAIVVVYGVGFYLIMNEHALAEQQLGDDKQATGAYDAALAEAKQYKANLTIANKVLSNGMSYSDFLTATAQALPRGSILTTLTLSNLGATSTATTPISNLVLDARTTSYDGALQLKDSLEKSDVFENVSLADVKKTEVTNDSTAIQKKYPFEVSVSVKISKPKAGL